MGVGTDQDVVIMVDILICPCSHFWMDCVINVINLLIQISYAITFVVTAMITLVLVSTTTMLKNADTIMKVKRGVIMVGMIVLIVNMVYMAKNLVATYLTANEEVGHEGTHAL